ncbi:multiple inositol polyphosphate phosphatase 1-like [Frankliniella occidentalis]|uniref:Multiple inositol polyphosphate phosphatase 1 n=1 Tax=Frankliniella occidentalis TaxID=133901 RepID=A0A6J1TC64_FRAOC|nr:multiple inositol polyphosphate phosphatase 1-like [Frankliniella occidentalis]
MTRPVVYCRPSGFITATIVFALLGRGAASSGAGVCNGVKFRNFGLNSAYPSRPSGDEVEAVVIQGCEPVNTFHLVRHGTRWGSSSDNKLILSLRDLQRKILDNGRDGRDIDLCEDDLRAIAEWTTSVDTVTSYGLTEQGQTDQLRLGSRFGRRFPFLRDLARDGILLKHGVAARTKESAEYFGRGLLRQDTSTDGYDYLCDFFSTCPKFDAQYVKYLVSGPYVTFQKGPEMLEMMQRVSTRLGFEETLSFDYIEAMYTDCALETAWNTSKAGHKPAWCSVFQDEDFVVLEYWADLQENQRTGYYDEDFHSKIGCNPIKEMYSFFENAIDDKIATKERARFYFTHDTLLNQVVTFLRLFKDSPPLTDSFRGERQWHVSHFSPFASNFGGTLFRCGAKSDHGSQFKVQFYLNEWPIEFDICNGSVCTWEQVTNIFEEGLGTCDTAAACTGLDTVVKTATSLAKKISGIFG